MGGARLTAEGSESLEDLKAMEAQGVPDYDMRYMPGLLRAEGKASGRKRDQYVHDCRDHEWSAKSDPSITK